MLRYANFVLFVVLLVLTALLFWQAANDIAAGRPAMMSSIAFGVLALGAFVSYLGWRELP